MRHMQWLLLAPAALVFSTLAAPAASSGMVPSPTVSPPPGCKPTSMCGNVQIPYPFAMRQDCALPSAVSWGNNFVVTCNDSFDPPKPFIGNLEVVSISLEDAQMVIHSFVVSICYNSSSNPYFKGSYVYTFYWPYLISHTSNEFTAIGCDTAALLANKETDDLKYFTGCISYCASVNQAAEDGDSCTGLGCCKTGIVANLDTMRVFWGYGDTNRNNNAWEFSPCGYAFVAKKGWYNFSRQDLVSSRVTNDTIPLVLDWAIRGGGSCVNESGILKGRACVSDNSICVNATNGDGYLCNCTTGYKGNPYIDGGCKSTSKSEALVSCTRSIVSPSFWLDLVDDSSLHPMNFPCSNLIQSPLLSHN